MSLTAKLKEEVSENCLTMKMKILNLASLQNGWMMSSLAGVCGMTHARAVTLEWMRVPLALMWLVPLAWMMPTERIQFNSKPSIYYKYMFCG